MGLNSTSVMSIFSTPKMLKSCLCLGKFEKHQRHNDLVEKQASEGKAYCENNYQGEMHHSQQTSVVHYVETEPDHNFTSPEEDKQYAVEMSRNIQAIKTRDNGKNLFLIKLPR